MKRIENYEGQLEKTEIEYDLQSGENVDVNVDNSQINSATIIKFDQADKTDYLVAASCGLLTGLLDSFWVGEFSLVQAQKWGREKANGFVVKVAQLRGYSKNELEGAIRFLEKDAPMASDKLTSVWGGGLQHHFRDFGHHASITGLVFSVMTQFTGLSYGTNTDGIFEIHELPDKSLLGKTFEEKIFNGVIMWGLHLVSDMAGSSSNAGKGTGIPGPLLSLTKELSVLPCIRNWQLEYNGEKISISVMLSKIFNGTAFSHTSNKDLTRFDLRTEMGVYAYEVKQSIPVVLNQCIVRAFYFIRRLCVEINSKGVKNIKDITKLESSNFLPRNNKSILRMITISSGVFTAVDLSDASIRAILSSPKSKGEFVAKLLLRTNFIGIGNFAIAIKNDISANLCGVKATPVNNNVQEEGTEKTDIFENITIEVSVDVDSSGIYEYAFYRMYRHVQETKNKFGAAQNVNLGIQRQVLELEDDETKLYDTVVSMSYHSLIVETEELLMRLLTFYGVPYVPFDRDEKYQFYMPFYRIEEGKKIAYVFAQSITSSINWRSIKETTNVDGIKIIALVELGDDTETRGMIINDLIRKSGGYIQYQTLQELFKLISDSEYEIYKGYVKKYNEDIKKLIGYRTIIIPSEESIQKLRSTIREEIEKADFKNLIKTEGVYNNQIKIIEDNFWRDERYKILLSNRSYAESFISSEWYFKTHTATSALEQTAIIAGYLKSVEQLLYAIIELSIDSGKTIKSKNVEKGNYISYSTENSENVDLTLGSMIGYLRHYSDLWDVNAYTKNFIVDKLNVYRYKYRNDHFHKDNINSENEIKEIRYNTLLIHYLLLGAIKIEKADEEKLGLGLNEDAISELQDLKYEDIEIWLNRILGGDVLLPASSKIYFEMGVSGRKKWRVEMATVSGFSEKKFPNDMQWPYIGDDLLWDSVQKKEDAEEKLISFLKKYLEIGKYAGNLKVYDQVYAGCFGHPILLYEN